MVLLIPLSTLIPVSLVVIILIVVMWFLYNKNKKIARKLISEKIRFSRYKTGVENLKKTQTTPKKDFETLNKYARAFFKEYLGLEYNLTYLELKAKFEKDKKPEYANFCKSMSDINYKGEKKNSEEVKGLINLFYELLEKY